MKRAHPADSDTDDDQNIGTTLTPFDQLPDEVLFHIFSFVSLPTLEDVSFTNSSPKFKIVSLLDETLGCVSDFLKKKVKEFVHMSPIRFEFWWRETTTYHEIAWLRDNQIRIGALDASISTWNHWNKSIFVYMLEQCDLTDLGQVIVDFSDFDDTPICLNNCNAAEAGIPQQAMDSIRSKLSFGDDCRLTLQRHALKVICDRASKTCVNVHFKGIITEGGDDFDFEFLTCQLVKLPLKKLHLELDAEDEDVPCLSQDDFAILSKGIESFIKLESLTLHIPGDCYVRSKSLCHLEYRGESELVSCECPLLESISVFFTNKKPGTLQLLSSVSHCIKKLCVTFLSVPYEQNTEQLTEIIHNMPLLEELRVSEIPSDVENRIPFCIKSKSLRRIDLVSCGDLVHISRCVCPNLEVIECIINRQPLPLVPVDDGIFKSLINLYYNNRLAKTLMFRDCPFTGCEVPGDCLMKLY